MLTTLLLRVAILEKLRVACPILSHKWKIMIVKKVPYYREKAILSLTVIISIFDFASGNNCLANQASCLSTII